VTTAAPAIDRLDAAAFRERLPELRAEGRPAIVTGLVGGPALEAANTIAGARKLIGDERVTCTVRYIELHEERVRRHIRGVPMPRAAATKDGTFAEYLDQAATDSRYIVTEQPSAPALLDGVDLSPLGVHSITSRHPLSSLASSTASHTASPTSGLRYS
jgi:hypothetical protein